MAYADILDYDVGEKTEKKIQHYSGQSGRQAFEYSQAAGSESEVLESCYRRIFPSFLSLALNITALLLWS